jgi:hypothetical protein
MLFDRKHEYLDYLPVEAKMLMLFYIGAFTIPTIDINPATP